jgi:hypothetical protein
MKKLLSILSGRLAPLLVLVLMVACFLAPADALAVKEMRIGRDRTGGGEGDPLDTNDVGGGGGDSDVHDEDRAPVIDDPRIIGFQGFRILLVPEFQHGKIIFRFHYISTPRSDRQVMRVEGYHAP